MGLDAAREAAKKKVKDIHFEPKDTSLDQPKEGEHDDKEHSGGNRWAGGVRVPDQSNLPVVIVPFFDVDWWQGYSRYGWQGRI